MTGTLTGVKLNNYFLGVDEPLYGVGQVIQLSKSCMISIKRILEEMHRMSWIIYIH